MSEGLQVSKVGQPDWVRLTDCLPRLWRTYQPYGPTVADPMASQMIENAVLSGEVPIRGERAFEMRGIERIDRLLGANASAIASLLLGRVTLPGSFSERRREVHFDRVEVDWTAALAYIVQNLLPKGVLQPALVAAGEVEQEPEGRAQTARVAATKQRDDDLQRAADEVWRRNPRWPKERVAKELHGMEIAVDRRSLKGGRLSVDRIIKIIYRPEWLRPVR